MADLADSILTVRLERLGRTTQNVKSYTIDSGFTTSTDGFEFVLYEKDRSLLRGLEMEPVELSLNGNSQAIGRIDVTERSEGSSITCRGRDYIADLVTNRIDPTFKVKKDATLFQVIGDAVAANGINNVLDTTGFSLRDIRTGKKVDAADIPGFKQLKQEDANPQPGEGVYQYINRLLKQFGGTLQPASSRDSIWITAPNYTQPALYSIQVSDDPTESGKNNVIGTPRATRDFSEFPTYVLARGKSGKAGAKKTDIAQNLEIQDFIKDRNSAELNDILRGVIYQGRRLPKDGPDGLVAGQLYRLLHILDKAINDQSQLERRSVREFSEMFKKTLVYECELRGHTDPVSGALWSTDTIVRVDDAIREVNEPMWIANRTFSFSPTQGARTRIRCWRLGAFQL